MLKLFTVIGFSISCQVIFSQELTFQKYDIKDGLAGNYVYHTVQDKDGFIWFATETGVSRFDGKFFQNFTTANGLPDNDIIKLYVDAKNRVWMLPFNSAVCYYMNGKLYTKNNSPLLKKIHIKKNIIKIAEDRKGNLFLVEPDEITLVDQSENVKKINQINNGYIGNIRVGLINSKGDLTFFATNYRDSIAKGDYVEFTISSGGSFIKLPYKEPQEFLFNPALFETFNQQIFAVTRNYKTQSRLLILNTATNSIKDLFINNAINTINIVNDSLIFLNTKNGSILYNYSIGSSVSEFFLSESVSCTFTDREANIWVTTLGNGVYKLPRERVRSVYFKSTTNAQNQIYSLYALNGNILAGSGEKMEYLIHPNKGILKNISINEGQTGKIIGIKKGDDVFSLGEYGLYAMNGLVNKSHSIIKNPEFLPAFKDFERKDADTWFIATSSGVFSMYKERIELKKPFFNYRATTIAVTDSGLYIGTLAGLFFKHFVTGDTNFLGMIDPDLSSRVTKCYAAPGVLYIGTNDRGLLCFDGKRVVAKYSVKNGLTSNLVRCLYSTPSAIWVGTDKGLNKITISDVASSIKKITVDNGLASDMINAVVVIDKKVFVGTSSGMSFFDDSVIQKKSLTSLRLLKLVASGNEKPLKQQPIILLPKENNVRIEYAGILLSDGGVQGYKYRISSIDSTWKTTTANFIDFPALPAGEHEISIIAFNKDLIESNIVQVSIIIEKRFFDKLWVRSVLILMVFLLIILIAVLQSKKLKKRQLVEFQTANRILELEQLALKSQMNPHFIFNCLNSIQQYVIEKDIKGANKFITSFARLIRQTLENSGKEKISIAEEIEFLTNYLHLEQIRFEGKFNFKIDVLNDIDSQRLYIPPMLLQPFVENSIRHGIRLKASNDGFIHIKVYTIDNLIVFLINDNGVGRKIAESKRRFENVQHQSKGVAITSQRLAAMNSGREKIEIEYEDLYSNKGLGVGTNVYIKFPKAFMQS